MTKEEVAAMITAAVRRDMEDFAPNEAALNEQAAHIGRMVSELFERFQELIDEYGQRVTSNQKLGMSLAVSQFAGLHLLFMADEFEDSYFEPPIERLQ